MMSSHRQTLRLTRHLTHATHHGASFLLSQSCPKLENKNLLQRRKRNQNSDRKQKMSLRRNLPRRSQMARRKKTTLQLRRVRDKQGSKHFKLEQ